MTTEELNHVIEDIISAAEHWVYDEDDPEPPPEAWVEAYRLLRAAPKLLDAYKLARSRIRHAERDCGIPLNGEPPRCEGCVEDLEMQAFIAQVEGT